MYIVRLLLVASHVLGSFARCWGRPVEGAPRFCLIKLDHLGDWVLATPAIRALRETYPTAYIAVVVGSYSEELARLNPHIDEVFTLDIPWMARQKRRAWRSRFVSLRLLALAWRLQRRRFDTAIDLSSNSKGETHLLAYLSGAETRIGDDAPGRGFLLTHATPFRPKLHALERVIEKVQAAGAHVADRRPEVFYSKEDEEAVEQWLADEGVTIDDLIVGIHPFAGCSSKDWATDRFATVADTLVERHQVKVLFTGAPKDRPAVKALLQRVNHRVINAVGRTSVSQLVVLLRRLGLLITVDAGPMHVAAALESPLVVLFSGTTELEGWRPVGQEHIILKHELECAPCHLETCAVEGHPCMARLSVDQVLQAAEDLLSTRRTARVET